MKTRLFIFLMFLSGLGFSQNFNINISPSKDTILIVQDVNGDIPVLDSVKIGDTIVIISSINIAGTLVIDTNGYYDTNVYSYFDNQLISKYKVNKNSSSILIGDSAYKSSVNKLATINLYLEKDTSTGIDRVDYQRRFKVFPNPSFDVLNIHSETPINRIEILDLLGRVVKSINISDGNSYRMSVLGIPSGIYFLKINDILTQKIVIMTEESENR